MTSSRLLLCTWIVFTGCAAEAGSDAGSGSGTSSASDGGTFQPQTTGMTTAATSTTTSATSSSTSVGPEGTSTTDVVDSGSFIAPPDGSSGGPGPNGADCTDPSQCVSGFCVDVPGPGDGVCSECNMDADCDMGTCSFDFQAGYKLCTDGALGDGCDSDEGCAGPLVCTTLYGDAGPHRCSECSATTPCAEGTTCSPTIGNSAFQGWLACVAPASVELGDGCPVVDGVGDGSVCVSGACGIATAMMGMLQIGICSECDDDTDCLAPATCQAPSLSMMMVTPGSCG